MPKRSSKLKNFLAGGLSGALSTAKSGNPYLIAGSALAGGTLGALQDASGYDGSAERAAFRRLEDNALRRSRRVSREIGSGLGSQFNARGIQGGLREGIIRGQQRFSEQQTLDRLAEMEYGLERDIAAAQSRADEQARINWNNQLATIAAQGSGLAQDILNPDPFKQDAPGITAARKVFGIDDPEKINIQDYFDIDGQKVRKNSPLGVIVSTSSDYAKQLAKAFGVDLTELGKYLGGR